MKHSPYSLHLEHLATDAGLLVLHTEDKMYLSSKRLKLLGTVSQDPSDGQHYLSMDVNLKERVYSKLCRMSLSARHLALFANNHTPS